jgi:hypothetical protein
MSELHQLLADTVAERSPWTSDPVQNLRTGKTFAAEIDGSPDALVVMSELGEDARNVILLHVTDDTQAYAIHAGDLVTFTLFGMLVKAKILKRRDSGGQVQTNFWAMQLTKKDN